MFVVLIAIDRKNSLDVRKANRDAHVAYLKSQSIVAQAGPFLDAAGDMCGSLIVLDVETMEQAEIFAANDPYKAVDLFETVTLRPWNRVIG